MVHTAILYIAERCNQKCVFCLEENGEWAEFVDPSTQEVYDVVDRLYDRGARQITFMGGETFFRKDLPRIIAHAKTRGYGRIGVTTNGTVLSKAGFIQKLVDAGLDFIEFSLHAHEKELANAISRSKITWDRQAQALREIDDAGTLVTIINVVVCHENREHLVEIVRHVLETYPRIPVRFKLKFVSLQGWAEDRADAAAALSYRDVDLESVGDYLEARGADFWFYNVPLCRLGHHAKRSHELAALAVDDRYYDYDHRQDAEYYDSGHQLEGRVWPGDSCGDCTLRPLCPGVEETYRLRVGDHELSKRADDPTPLLHFAIESRGEDASQTKTRLASLKREARPGSFIRARADGAIRFLRPGRGPFDVMVEARAPGRRAYAESEHYLLSHRVDDAMDRNPDENVTSLLGRLVDALGAADREGADLEGARRAVASAGGGYQGWQLDGTTDMHAPQKKEKRLVILPDLTLPR